jgi:hypothetical protein
MALALTLPLPEGDGRLKQTITRELVIARRAADAGKVAPLAIPETPPTPNPQNSWITYDDPFARFHFLHPQELRLPPGGPPSEDEVTLFDLSKDGTDVVSISLQPKADDPVAARKLLDPDSHRKNLEAGWQKQKLEVLPVVAGWLPEADWASLDRKVYRIEAALKPPGSDPGSADRIYVDYYLVVFGRNASMVVNAMTRRDPHLDFRNQVEQLIRSYKFGSSEGPGADLGAGARPEARPGARPNSPRPVEGRSPARSAPSSATPPPAAEDASPFRTPGTP